MAQFIHLADDKDLAMIRKNGIIASKLRDEGKKAVFATPVLQDFYRSHQWLRELKRRGVRTFSAVQFRVGDDTPVSVGRYNEEHLETTAAEAVRIFMDHQTGAGLEVIFSTSIPASAIMRTYTPDQVTGWRYFPEAHGKEPCGCSYCQRGEIRSQRLRSD
ncbi:hypothetical protein [Luteolibacter luteus]|uniref:Uncharacterized protein n=1 Tax=Luteolibacter luteus TaxID=2728835 RepID=A0A858RS66_9BACT|nr:hypothetical protein [Luteolibacter luteus]QJE98783.1 hypothetical protein HHL09_24380 [Luteolibacter luteus]